MYRCFSRRQSSPLLPLIRSRHSGGVNAVLCDGSVHYYRDDIELGIWRLLARWQAAKFLRKTEWLRLIQDHNEVIFIPSQLFVKRHVGPFVIAKRSIKLCV